MIRTKIIEIVKDVGDLGDEVGSIEDLVSGGYLDSFAILMIVSRLEKEFGVKLELGEDINSKFNSINSIEILIRK